MNTERLIRLADKLEGKGPYADVGPVQHDQFNIAEWFRRNLMGEDIDQHACGFAACAVGHACLDPWFNDEGLRHHKGMWNHSPLYDKWIGNRAVEEFFGLDVEDMEFLFFPNSYMDGQCDRAIQVKPHMVAERIRVFVASKCPAV